MSAISVVIPCYNCSGTIEETVQSVFDQTFKNYEIIIVDDGSTDNSCEIIKRISSSIVLISQKNRGVSSARNKGVLHSKSDMIAFLDGDDLWERDKLKIQVDVLDSGYDMVHSVARNFGNIGSLNPKYTEYVDICSEFYLERLFYSNFIVTSSVVIKKNTFVNCKGFNESLVCCEDWDLWLRVAEKFKITCVPNPLINYRVTSFGLSSSTGIILSSGVRIIKSNISMIPICKRKNIMKNAICNVYLDACWRYLRDHCYCKSFKCSLKAIFINPFKKECWKWLVRVFVN